MLLGDLLEEAGQYLTPKEIEFKWKIRILHLQMGFWILL